MDKIKGFFMGKIKKNTVVSMLIKFEDKEGNIIDQSEELMYLHGGYNQIFQKLETELEGKKVGDTFCVSLTSAETFGEYDESLVLRELLEDLPEDIAIGTELDSEEDGMVYVIESIDEKYAILNANHELAGVPLIAIGKILEIEQLTDEGAAALLKSEDHH